MRVQVAGAIGDAWIARHVSTASALIERGAETSNSCCAMAESLLRAKRRSFDYWTALCIPDLRRSSSDQAVHELLAIQRQLAVVLLKRSSQ
jgi:hypothetical protein